MNYCVSNAFFSETVGDECVLSLWTGDYAILNESAALALDCIRNLKEGSEEDVARSFVEAYGIDEAIAKRDARKALSQLRRVSAVEPCCKRRGVVTDPHRRITRRAFVAGMTATGLSLIKGETALGVESAVLAENNYDGEAFTETVLGDDIQAVTDSLGRFVELPKQIERVAPYGPFAQALLESIDANLVAQVTARGLHASFSANSAGEFVEQLSGIEKLDDYAMENAIPDFVLDLATSKDRLCTDIDQQADAAGVPVVHFVVEPGRLAPFFRSLGCLLGKEDRCDELANKVASIEVALAQIREQFADAPQKRVYYGQGPTGFKTRGVGTLLDWAIQETGAENVADRLDESFLGGVDPEWIFECDPDVVVLSTEEPFYVGDESDEEEPFGLLQDIWTVPLLADLRCVSLIPIEPFAWLGRSPLAMQTVGVVWLADLIHPNCFNCDVSILLSDLFACVFSIDVSPDDLVGIILDSQELVVSAGKDDACADIADSGQESCDSEKLYSEPAVEVVSATVLSSSSSVMSSGGYVSTDDRGKTPVNPYYLLSGMEKSFTLKSCWFNYVESGSIELTISAASPFTVYVYESAAAAGAGSSVYYQYSDTKVKSIPLYGLLNSIYINVVSSDSATKRFKYEAIADSMELPYGGHWIAVSDPGSVNAEMVTTALYFFPPSKAAYLVYAILADENEPYITDLVNNVVLVADVVKLVVLCIANAMSAGTIAVAEAAAWTFISDSSKWVLRTALEELLLPILKEHFLPVFKELALDVALIYENGEYRLSEDAGFYLQIDVSSEDGLARYSIDKWDGGLAQAPLGEIGAFFAFPEEGL